MSRTTRLLAAAASLIVMAGCRNGGYTLPALPRFSMQLDPKLVTPKYDFEADSQIDMHLLNSTEFYPPGAVPLLNPDPVLPAVVATAGARFPSDEICTSNDGQWALYENARADDTGIRLSLMALKTGAESAQVLYSTVQPHAVLWAPDCRRAAVTVYGSPNQSFVFLVDVTTQALSDPLPLRDALDRHFPQSLLDSPQFMVAHRWTAGNELIVRGAGRTAARPYVLFGYEALVTLTHQGTRSIVFLRGYTKPALRP